jgi:hypothetical protein
MKKDLKTSGKIYLAIAIAGIITFILLICSFAPRQERSEPMVTLESDSARAAINLKIKQATDRAMRRTKVILDKDSTITMNFKKYLQSGKGCGDCHSKIK